MEDTFVFFILFSDISIIYEGDNFWEESYISHHIVLLSGPILSMDVNKAIRPDIWSTEVRYSKPIWKCGKFTKPLIVYTFT